MSGIGEGIGAAIEGGLLGQAVEPDHGKATAAAHAPAECLNCGSVVTGHYCGQCGQKAHVHRSLSAIGHDIMHGVLHLDGKLWNTLPLLTFKPGKLTRRYIAGERAKFVSPMAMFLFSVFAMFAVFQMVGISPTDDIAEGWSNYSGKAADKSTFKSSIQQQITTLEQERDGLVRGDKRRGEIDAEVQILQTMISSDGASRDSEIRLTGIKFLDEGLVKKWQKNPSLMLYKLQANAYKFSWLLIPLSIPFVWLMFAWRRQFKAYDHAVFVTYSLAFMSLMFITMSIISAIPNGGRWAALLFLIGAPLHLYKQLRHTYGRSRFTTLVRFFTLLLFAVPLVLLLFLQALLLLGAF
jgi:hypothetical protein